jgi:hypothetical protein
VLLLLCGLQVLGGDSYLSAALRAGELVWQRGLLTKGPGLCHGVAGNAYALAQVYKATRVSVDIQAWRGREGCSIEGDT